MNLKAGDRLLHYEIVRPLGQGGLGVVYLAWDANLEQQVAIKMLHETGAPDSMRLHRLRTGARVAAHLRHPHIQHVFYQGADPVTGASFVVMEYLPGGDLRARIGKLTLDEALRIFGDICDALAYAHEHGVIHRDLKPDNVLLNEQGEVVVTDFDLARLEGGARHTVGGQLMGTMFYLSPEQARGDKLDHTADIYSLGVMLFELATGTLPFSGQSAMDLYLAHLQAPPPLASLRNPAVPDHVDRAIVRAMAKTPADRFQDARELAAAARGIPYTPPIMETAPLISRPVSRPVEETARPPSVPLPAAPASVGSASQPAEKAEPGGRPSAGATAITLLVLDGPMAGTKYSLSPPATIGRIPGNDVVLPDQYVSSRHARIDIEEGRPVLRDLKSSNGTRVNGVPLAANNPQALQPGDVIHFGTLRVRVDF